jgi:hypothetical protein
MINIETIAAALKGAELFFYWTIKNTFFSGMCDVLSPPAFFILPIVR